MITTIIHYQTAIDYIMSTTMPLLIDMSITIDDHSRCISPKVCQVSGYMSSALLGTEEENLLIIETINNSKKFDSFYEMHESMISK